MPIRTGSGGGTHDFLSWLTRPGRWRNYSIGFTITEDIQQAILRLPKTAWTSAYDADGLVSTWPTGRKHAPQRACGTPPPGAAAGPSR
ncbi:hypothetical protein [Nonomuraea sp. NPDC003804]|uniref:hypothetical protein n=1 Tax=Nonomuraea sp. NPDC003804 TaxID=3154547 RepID=UPI0033A8A774